MVLSPVTMVMVGFDMCDDDYDDDDQFKDDPISHIDVKVINYVLSVMVL